MRKKLGLGLCLWVAACGGEEVVPASCSEDFDCAAGEVCTVDGDEGTCGEAAAGATRTFGQVTLDFATGNETYLMAVYGLPRGEAAGGGFAPFTLTPAGSSGQALRFERPKPTAPNSVLNGRLTFEKARRDAINALVEELRAGTTRIDGNGARKGAACSEACDEQSMCWDGECVSEVTLSLTSPSDTVTCDLHSVVSAGGVTVNVLVDQDADVNEGDLEQAVDDFLAAMPRELTILGLEDGHTGSVDRDNDGRLTLVFTNAATSDAPIGNVGFFDFRDFLAAGATSATGNESDILWARVPGSDLSGGEFTPALAVGTLTHEYVHLVNFATRVYGKGAEAVGETLWLDEAMAHTMEDLSGWGPSNVGYVVTALGEWPDAAFAGPDDTNGQRGKAYLFLRHIIEDKAAGASNAASSQVYSAAQTVYTQLLNESAVGFEHALFKDGKEQMKRALLASYASGNESVTVDSAHAADFLDMVDATSGNLTGITAFGEVVDARGEDLTLEGPQDSADFTSFDEAFEESAMLESGSLYYIVSGGTGSVVLRGTSDAAFDLNVFAEKIAE